MHHHLYVSYSCTQVDSRRRLHRGGSAGGGSRNSLLFSPAPLFLPPNPTCTCSSAHMATRDSTRCGVFLTQEGNFFSPHFFAPRLRVGGMPLNHSQRGRPGVRKGALCVPPCVGGGGGGRSFQPPPSEDHTSSRVHQKNWKRAMQRATRYCPFLSLSFSEKRITNSEERFSKHIPSLNFRQIFRQVSPVKGAKNIQTKLKLANLRPPCSFLS